MSLRRRTGKTLRGLSVLSWRASVLALLLASTGLMACGGDEGGASANAGDESDDEVNNEEDDALPAPEPFPEADTSTLDFLVTELNFYFPEGIAPQAETVENPCGLNEATDNTSYKPLNLEGLTVEGFDLDSQATEASQGLCAQQDFSSGDGAMGIDYSFLHVIDKVRPARPGQTIQTVLATAPAQGLIKVGMRVSGVDDMENDDSVSIFVAPALDTPLLGGDGKIIGRGSVAIDPDPTFHNTLEGQIVDGVLTASADTLRLGHINLLVIEERIIELQDVRIRATLSARPDGVLDADILLAGWWMHDNMLEAVDYALTTIGANEGELDCVLERYSDHSSDGVNCDGMSMIFRVTAVSGFLTGLDDEGAAADDGAEGE